MAVGQIMAGIWARAAVCADRHKVLHLRERGIKNAIASTYPAFHTAITTPPLSKIGKELALDAPYRPESNPFYTEKFCETNFTFLKHALDDAEWKQVIQQCWERPRGEAKESSSAPR